MGRPGAGLRAASVDSFIGSWVDPPSRAKLRAEIAQLAERLWTVARVLKVLLL